MKIKITINPSLDKVAKPYKSFKSENVQDAIKEMAKLLHKYIYLAAPKRTGTGRKAITLKKQSKLEWRVFIDPRMKGGDYMGWQHEGVPPSKINPILPVKKKALWWPGLQHPVAAVYNHPGIRANPFFELGEAAALPEIEATQKKIGTDIVRYFEF